MAINIFQGGTPKKGSANSASASSRARAAKAALTGASEASTSGNTAVGTSGTLSKVGNFVGKAAGIAAKFLPGVGGVISKGLANIFNDPEWWQSVPGDAVTLNEPLRFVDLQGSVVIDSSSDSKAPTVAVRPAFAQFVSLSPTQEYNDKYVIAPSEQMATQYLLPQIRKVVNAVPLQNANHYKIALANAATMYALWRQLLKMRFLLQHGHTYIANLNEPSFPLFQTENAAFLDSTINRVEEYLRSNVRLPHTLCEYLAWRYGRLYKAHNSAKSAFVTYDVLAWTEEPAVYTDLIALCMARITDNREIQKANADMYNAYYDHDMAVEIRDDTQGIYDSKEFALRTNLDVLTSGYENAAYDSEGVNPVFIDSSLDIPTAFMASTVSTLGQGYGDQPSVLFPVRDLCIYIPVDADVNTLELNIDPEGLEYQPVTPSKLYGRTWMVYVWHPTETTHSLPQAIMVSMLMKPLDIYNKNVYVGGAFYTYGDKHEKQAFDITSLSYDMGLVPNLTIGNEQIYAFANLVDQGRKTSLSYKQAEKLVSKEAAEFVDKLPVASVAPAPQPK